jgi:hypothetical protein
MPKNGGTRTNPGRARLSLGFLFLLAALALGAESRFSISPYLDYNYSSNIFWNVNQVADHSFSPGLDLDWRLGDLDLFISADGRFYHENSYMNSARVAGGFSLVKVVSSRTSFFVSPDVTITRSDKDLSFLDTNIPGITLGIKQVLSGRLFGRLGLSARYSDYINEDSYDRARLAAFLDLSAFFPSQTTLRLTAGLNYLRFPHVAVYEDPADGTSSGGGNGQMNGRGGSIRPLAPTDSGAAPSSVVLAIPQPYVVARVAQGIGFTTGVYAEVMLRRNLDALEGIQAIAASEWALEQTDDDFFWEGERLSIGLKTEAVLGLEIALDLSRIQKRYRGIEALDLDGLPVQPLATREDTLSQASLRIAKRIRRTGLSAAVSYRRNGSNDLYFRYDFLTITAGVQFDL